MLLQRMVFLLATFAVSMFPPAVAAQESNWALEFKVAPHAEWRSGGELVGIGDELSLVVNGELLEARIKTASHAEPLVIGVPLAVLNANRQHVFLVRFLGFRADLLCDGVVVDEEWPMGQAQVSAKKLTFHEPIRQARLLAYVPTDREIEQAYGGAAAIAKRTDEMLGPEPRDVQYMKPRGWNTNAGDAMPFYHDGTFHLFYLIDRRHHHSKWGLGAHQWAHIASRDLIHWTSYPLAIAITHEWEGSICTGSVFCDGGMYYAFYATRMPDRSEHLAIALSKDGIHFDKVEPSPFDSPQAPFRKGPNRDPHVNRDEQGYLMTVTAAIAGENGGKEQGALEELRSNDLKSWVALTKPFLIPGYGPQPECSNLFFWRGRYYLLFGINGVTHYRIGTSLHGPWTKPEVDVLDAQEARVMKTAEFRDHRRMLVGWIGYDNFGGNLFFRELVQNADGSLGTKFPKEMNSGTQVVQRAGAQRFELNFDGKDGRNEKLAIDPANGTVQWLAENGQVRDELVGIADLDKDARIEIARKNDLVDICVNQSRTMIHRLK